MTEYAYKHPRQESWVGSFSSREIAAQDLLANHPMFLGGHTAPILAKREGMIIIDRNSLVHFQKAGAGNPDQTIQHNPLMLRDARVK